MVEYFKMDYVKGGTSAKYTKFIQAYSKITFDRFCMNNNIIVERKTPITFAQYKLAKPEFKQTVFMGTETLTE